MSIADKVAKVYGLRRYLDGFEIDVDIEKEKPLNRIFLAFAKDAGWEDNFVKPKRSDYKRRYEPSLDNAEIVSANFKEFAKWVNATYKRK